MIKRHMIAFFSVLLVMMFMVPIQANARDHGFTEKCLRGTYYIPCACEGNEVSTGGSIHSTGMGKIYFDGKGGATITQQHLYKEVGNKITRIVKDGVILPMDHPAQGHTAQFKGSYEVNHEGFGMLFDGAFPPKESEFTPSFMITKVKGGKATEIYLILPQNFIDYGMEPKHLIHVTAARR